LRFKLEGVYAVVVSSSHLVTFNFQSFFWLVHGHV